MKYSVYILGHILVNLIEDDQAQYGVLKKDSEYA